MKLIYHMSMTELDATTKKWLLINALFGSVDIIEDKYSRIIDKWLENDDIIPVTEDENRIYNFLLERKYLISSSEEENNIKGNILNKLKLNYNHRLENISNIVLVFNYDCNFSCPYCYENNRDNANNKYSMTEEMVDKIYSLHSNITGITLFGGEPLLLENMSIIKYIIQKSPNARYNVFTNGYFLEEYIPLLKKLDIGFIQVTIDGEEEVHNRTRILKNGEATYKKIMEGIKACLVNNIPIKIRMNISEMNLNSCNIFKKNFLDEFSDYKQNISFEMQPLYQLNGKAKMKLDDELYWNSSIIGKYDEGFTTDNVILNTASPIVKLFLLNNTKIYPQYSRCAVEQMSRFYDSMGDMYSCFLSVGNESNSIGTYYPNYALKENSLIDRNIESIEKCSKCRIALICGGGCGNAARSSNKMVPNCEQILDDIHVKIPKLYRIKQKN